MDECFANALGRRRIFWSTQPQGCGTAVVCGEVCSIPGLVYTNPTVDPAERSIEITEWLRGLILNILNTKARSDRKCPSPAAIFGHWSESYRDDNLYIGSTLWNAADKNYTRINDAVKAVSAAVKADMAKLPAMGVASSVEVVTEYIGRNQMAVEITVFVQQTKHVISMSGGFSGSNWVWQ